MRLQSYVPPKRALIIELMNQYLDKKSDERTDLPFFKDTIDRFRTFIPNGKLIRGVLVMLCYEMMGKRALDVAAAALAIEFTQSTLLMHDDIMDQDENRRGARTVYAQYMDHARESGYGNPLLYGQSLAVCVGDIGFYFAFELLNSLSAENEVLRRVLTEYAREIQYVGAAQMADVDLSYRKTEASVEDILTVYRYKTGRYSFSLPMKLGAILGGAPEETIDALDRLGEELGIMFQIHDDYLGLTGNENQIGKPVGTDIKSDKKTIIRKLLFERATGADAVVLNQSFGNVELTAEDHAAILRILSRTGISAEIERMMEERASAASDIIRSISVPDDYKHILTDLVTFNKERTK